MLHNTKPVEVLIVDDDPGDVDLMRETLDLSKLTVNVQAIFSGEEALKSFFSDRPDLALLDLEMPGMDGFELCERIRQMSDVPIIFLTAFGSETHRVKGLQVGAGVNYADIHFYTHFVRFLQGRIHSRPGLSQSNVTH